MSVYQITDIRRLTEADKICICVVDLPMILIEALKTFMNHILDFKNLGRSAILAQVSFRNSKTGIVWKVLGSFELENVCFVLAAAGGVGTLLLPLLPC